MRLTLFIADLLWPEPEDGTLAGIDCPALAALLARGACTRRPGASLEDALREAFGQSATVSYAALRRAGEDDTRAAPEATALVCCDPVHLRLHEDHLVLAGSASLGLKRAEADTFVAALNDAFSDVGRFEAASAERWYLRLADASLAEALDTPPLSLVAGRAVEHLLSDSAVGKGLRHFLNEAQMLMHAHPLNEARERRGELPVNGLWLWGVGAAPCRIDSDFDGVWGSDALAHGLARCAGVPAHREPRDAATLAQSAAPASVQLVVIGELSRPTQEENGIAYREAMTSLEERWFAPLEAMLAKGEVETLAIVAPTTYGLLSWTIRRGERWKFWRHWRQAQPLAGLARELHDRAQ